MCVLLGDFLRDTLNVSARERIPLADELALADRFLEHRAGAVRRSAAGRAPRRRRRRRRAVVPPLLLQPLVENAVTHGIAGLLEGGVIRLDVSRRNGRLSIAIENPRDTDVAAARARRRRPRERAPPADRHVRPPTRGIDTRADAGRFRVELAMPCLTDD